MPSGHDGGMQIMVGPQPAAPPEPLPATPPVAPLPPSLAVPEISPLPSPDGCRARLPQLAAQTTANETAKPSAPTAPLPEAVARLPFRAIATLEWQGFQAQQSGVGTTGRTASRPRSTELPQRARAVIRDTADLCGEPRHKA